ncbi:MAG TPA: PAS domain S-box protein [Blastocatellia bacterium]|nr:PAS domain S-box protein [Blastocatellia bacterium]
MNNNARRQKEKPPKVADDKLFGRMIESATEHAIMGIDLEGRIFSWNTGAEKIFGYRREEIIGESVSILFTPEDRRSGAPTQELNKAGARGSAEDYRWQLRKDGSRFWASGLAYPLRDEDENLIAYVKVARDATEKKLADETLMESEADFRAVFNLAGTGKALADLRTGRLLRVNQRLCDITGYSGEELLTMTIQELTRPEDREQDFAVYQRMLRGKGEYETERSYVRKDGSVAWVHINVVALRDEKGNPIRATASAIDITRRKQAEERLKDALSRERAARAEAESANRAKDEFIALVSHELRSPLTAILGWARILRQGSRDERLLDQSVEVIDRNARMQSQLIEDLLDASRAISGKLKLEIRLMDLAEVIEKAEEVVRPAAEAKGVSLDVRVDRNVGRISGDPDRLQQAVWNLLSNAIKFTEEGGSVEVRLERIDPYIQIAVRDTGQGIKPEFLPYVFNRYSQAETSGSRRAAGLGLGLSLTRQLVEMHGGKIMAESEGEGKGSTFTIKLPVHAIYAADTEVMTPASGREKSLAGAWVVVVDDEANARALITTVLELNGARVTAFGSARQALDLLMDDTAPRPHVLISDLAMPGEDGISLIRNLREWERAHGGALPAVALTAFGGSQDRIRALEAGFQTHVAKPAEPAELIIVVRDLIQNDLRRENDAERQG